MNRDGELKSFERFMITEERLIKLHFLKTARYTIQGPLLMGAYLSGNKKYIQDIKDYGKYAFIARYCDAFEYCFSVTIKFL